MEKEKLTKPGIQQKLEEFEVRHLARVVELSNKLQLHEPKQSTGHRLTGLSFRMAWLRDFEPSQTKRALETSSTRYRFYNNPLRNHGISASLQGHKGTVNP
jgi:hypothetical protein